MKYLLPFIISALLFPAFAAPLPETQSYALDAPKLHEDFPALALDADGQPWVVYITYNGSHDVLRVARIVDGKLTPLGDLSAKGIVHQPSISLGQDGALHVFWSEVHGDQGRWDVCHRIIRDGKIEDPTTVPSNNAIFADSATGPNGFTWVTWQSFREGPSAIYAKYRFPSNERWSDEFKISDNPGGNDWAPRIAFAGDDPAPYIAYDSTRAHNFDVVLAQVTPGGKVTRTVIAETPSYEARVSLAAAPDGATLWLAWERGYDRWGGDRRSHDFNFGLNANKRIDVVQVDTKTKKVTRTPMLRPLLSRLAKSGSISLNIPEVFCDETGTPWLLLRYATRKGVWRVALTRYDTTAKKWAVPMTLPNSSFGQERPSAGAVDGKGTLWLVRPSDGRKNKAAANAHVYLSSISTDLEMPLSEESTVWEPYAMAERNDEAKATMQRPRDMRHTWTINGKTYTLYYGDFHRHTSVSNCRTATDGSVVEQYRYGIGTDALDYLGPSDHTDAGKPYHPYEWWENQKIADLFHAPGYFNSFYVYEREQRWPWGHRNVVFADRGGPVVYINRTRYLNSPWQDLYPVAKAGNDQISPMELWDLLEKSGKAVTVISHTGATGMGTNWEAYKNPIDLPLESVVEIYQSARVSYEGIDLPQPTVGLQVGKKFNQGHNNPSQHKTNFSMYKPGVYQNALKQGHRLGIFASSDHISTHTAFGCVYAEDFTRESILEAIEARRTLAATDKIFAHFTCNGQPMGSVLKSDGPPKLEMTISGTAPLKRVTVVRNESNYQVFEPGTAEWKKTYTDQEPLEGVNRYYLRIEQADGNMAWASPVWVTVE